MNKSLISFIVCTKTNTYMDIFNIFLGNLIIPDNIEIEVIEIKNPLSLTQAYNSGMKKAKGKIKVYIKPNLYVCNPYFIQDILNIFKDPSIGLIGLTGSTNLPIDAPYHLTAPIFGSTFEVKASTITPYIYENSNSPYTEVLLVDGLLIATQYDIDWREDIFDGWDYFDYSHSLEFIRNNKKVVVPNQPIPWGIHICNLKIMTYHEKYRLRFLKEYINDIQSHNNIN